jgi:hypothetical protein
MSVLPAGRSLANFLPDLDDFLHDPRPYLQAEPLVIGPRRMYGLAALFALPGIALLVSCISHDHGMGERLALGIGLTLGGCVWLFWSLLMRGHSLVLLPDGVEVRYRDTLVWCPWAVFNADGSPFVPEADSPRVGLTLPVASEAIAFVELRRNESVIAHGVEVRGRQWLFTGRDVVVLPARYEVAAGDLGHLLLLLGRRLGRELPRGAPPREAQSLATLDEVRATPDGGGWLTVPLTRLVFPPVCCDCGTATQAQMPLSVAARGDRLASLFVQQVRPLELGVPVCEGCQHRMRQEVQRGGAGGLALGAAAGLGLGLLLWKTKMGGDTAILLPLILGGAAVGGIVGFLLGVAARRRMPAELAHYSPSRGTVAVRFRNPDYMALLLENLRARANRG